MLKPLHYLFLGVLVIVIISGCAGKSFKEAEKIDTISSYKKFILKYSDEDDLVFKARSRIEELSFFEAKKLNSINSYTHFLKKHPSGIFSSEAKEIIEELSYFNAKKSNSVKAYKSFLAKYPVGRYSSEIRSTLEDGIWNNANSIDSKGSYELYLRDYKNGRYSNAARHLIKILSYKNIISQYNYINNGIDGKINNFEVTQKYLNLFEKLFYTKRNITVIDTKPGGCREIFILGKECKTNIYTGRILKDDLIFMSDKYNIRTLHQVNSINKIPQNKAREAYGSIRHIKEGGNIKNSDLFTKQPPKLYAKKYYPTTFNRETSNWSGWLHDIGKWMEKNPELTAVLGAATYLAVTSERDNSSGATINQTTDHNYGQCHNNAIKNRIATCNVVPQFNCNMIGCPDDKIECNKGWSGRVCESNSAGAYYRNTFGLKDFYCDIKDNDNRDSDINVVIKNICK